MRKLLLSVLLLAAPVQAQQVVKLPVQDKALTGKPTVQFSIGAEDGEDWELLSRVTQVAFDREENLYVLDSGNHRVLVFNPQGKFVRKIGKKGGGPGELMAPVGVAFTTDGYIAVTDLGRPGVSLFRKDGTFVKNLNLGEESGFPAASQGTYAHPSGGVVVRSMPSRMIRSGGPGEVSTRPMTNRKSPVTWFTTAGKQTTLFEIPQPDVTPKVEDSGAGSGGRQVSFRVQLPAFTPPTLWGVLPNGSVVASYDDNYRLEIASNGKVQRVVERPIAPRKVTDADKQKEIARRRQQMQSGTGGGIAITRQAGPGGSSSNVSTGGAMPRQDIEQTLRELTFRETIPALAGLYVDPLGRMWVQRSPREIGGVGPIDLIAADGRYIGTLSGQTLPVAVSPSGRAAYVERDDMDVEKVVVRRLPTSWR